MNDFFSLVPFIQRGFLRYWSDVIYGWYFNTCRWFLSVFELDTRVMISCVFRIPRDIIVTLPRLPLYSGTQTWGYMLSPSTSLEVFCSKPGIGIIAVQIPPMMTPNGFRYIRGIEYMQPFHSALKWSPF